jgi:MSHA pilin protein MshD
MSIRPVRAQWRGVSLIELVVFMVIVGLALAGMFAVFDTMNRGSADPQVRKQVVAIAESLMAEVTLMPLTYCDPDDDLASTATSSAGCTGGAGGANDEDRGATLTFETGEDRYGTTAAFDNVSDYNGFSLPAPPGIKSINDYTTAITGLENYSASISVTRAGTSFSMADGDALRITVVVTGPGGVSMTLESYRMRYAPNTLP